ncbi:MAG: energy transducer TonB [Novosphingobium sp.]
MATVAAMAPDELAFAPASAVVHEPLVLPHPNVDSASGHAPARSVYSPAKANPVALLASAGMILGMAACLATLNIVAAHKERAHLSTVDVKLDVTPPPPPPEPTKLETPQAAVTQTVVPKPMIELPSPGPQQVMVDAPPPPAPPVKVSEGVKVSAPPAVAPPAATTLEGGDLSSKVLFAKPPTYPVDARRAHEQGTVKLLLLVGSDGTVKDIQVASSSGSSRLDGAALRAVRHWRWSPLMSNGVATAVRGYVTIPFVLRTA